MLSIRQKAIVQEWLDERKQVYRDIIENRPIERIRANGQTFFAEVNASGALRDSWETELSQSKAEVRVNSYIQWLITGRPPGGMPPVSNIEGWMQSKGIGGSAWAISQEIAARGTSIWKRWRGQDSGLLDGLFDEDEIEDLVSRLGSVFLQEETSEIEKLLSNKWQSLT
jgi:muconolactone delta-isomerase